MTAVWIDGQVVPADEARVSPFDHGLTVGDGVFETLQVIGRVPFAWTRHYERLSTSASSLGIAVRPSDELRAGASQLLLANELTDARLRVTVTAGEGPPGSGRAPGPPVTIMIALPPTPPDPTVSVVVSPWTRNERGACAGIKTVSYASNVRALAYAQERGAGEALFENTRGELCEATGSNVFIVNDEALATPPLDAGCLAGVTRALILELAPTVGIEAVERPLTVADLRHADEAFLSSTTRIVQPIECLEGERLRGVGGSVSQALATAFAELVDRDMDP